MKHNPHFTYCLTIYNTRGNVISYTSCLTLVSLRFVFKMARNRYKSTCYRFAIEVYSGSNLFAIDMSRRIKKVSMSRFIALASSLRLTALNNL